MALYNAINNTNYSNVDDLEITTLENAIYMTVKNDVSFVVDMTREYQKIYPLQEAINMAVEECIRKGILADFLRKTKSEVISMSIFEYNEKLHEQTLREEGEEKGREKERATNIARSIASLRAIPLTNTQIAEYLVNTFDLTIEQANQYIYDSESK